MDWAVTKPLCEDILSPCYLTGFALPFLPVSRHNFLAAFKIAIYGLLGPCLIHNPDAPVGQLASASSCALRLTLMVFIHHLEQVSLPTWHPEDLLKGSCLCVPQEQYPLLNVGK